MASSQARLLTITARMHDVEYQAQSIQNAKIALANQEDDIQKRYLAALDDTTLAFRNTNGEYITANFNNLCGINSVGNPRNIFLKDEYGRIIVSDEIAEEYEEWIQSMDGNNLFGPNPYTFAMHMIGNRNTLGAYELNNLEIENLEDLINNGNPSTKLSNLYKAVLDQKNVVIEKINKYLDDSAKIGNYGSTDSDNTTNEQSNTASKDDQVAVEAQKTNMDSNSSTKSGNYDISEEDSLANSYAMAHGQFAEIVKNNPEVKEEWEKLVKLETDLLDEFYSGEGKTLMYQDCDISDEDFDNNIGKYNYYIRIFNLIQENGGAYVPISKFNGNVGGDAASDSKWLQEQIQAGKITIFSTDKGKNEKAESVASSEFLQDVNTTTIDKTALAKAEAEYEHDMKQIDRKDKKFDMDLNKLETERTALKTEYDSVKKVIEDNIERTFGIFS